MPTASQSPGNKQNLVKILRKIGILLTSRTIAERENLRAEIVLLQLSALSKIPRSHGVVQATGPKFCTIGTNIYARSAVRMSLELPYERLILKIPDRDVSVAAA
jgi:hypothetical protein